MRWQLCLCTLFSKECTGVGAPLGESEFYLYLFVHGGEQVMTGVFVLLYFIDHLSLLSPEKFPLHSVN